MVAVLTVAWVAALGFAFPALVRGPRAATPVGDAVRWVLVLALASGLSVRTEACLSTGVPAGGGWLPFDGAGLLVCGLALLALAGFVGWRMRSKVAREPRLAARRRVSGAFDDGERVRGQGPADDDGYGE